MKRTPFEAEIGSLHHSKLIELATTQGSAWADPKQIVIVGAPFQAKPITVKPKTTMSKEEKAALKAEAEHAPIVRVLFMAYGHKLFILDTPENLAALGL